MSNLTELDQFRYDPETGTMYERTGSSWLELGCVECYSHDTLPAGATQTVVAVDE